MIAPGTRIAVDLVLSDPDALPLLNAERSDHWRVHRDRTKYLREQWGWVALAARCPTFAAVEVTARPQQGRLGRLADVGNHYPAVKAAIDGLVDAGIIPDDGPTVVTSLKMLAPTRAEDGVPTLRLLLQGIKG